MEKRYDIYLRKSRADREAEAQGQHDTLLRHRTALLALAQSMGLTVHHIFEEVVSGERIANRPEMQKLLAEVETGAIDGVLVMEVERLARGNTRDQGIVADTFQYSGTKIITPLKTYDPSDESDQEYFEFGLFMSRREYQTINRRLQRGRMTSLREGKYIAGTPPYGYERHKLKGAKGYTLAIVEEQANVVRHIYALYVDGLLQPDGSVKLVGSGSIARQLDLEGFRSPTGGPWSPCTVRDILKNPTYAGYVRWSRRPVVKQIVEGALVEKRRVNPAPAQADGLHPAIISPELWRRAQDILASRTHLPMPGGKTVVNPLAGLVYCQLCGRSLVRLKGHRGKDTLMCPNRACSCKGSNLDDIESALLLGLSRWLDGVPLGPAPGSGPETEANMASLERALVSMARERDTLTAQRGRLYDLLERGTYSPDLFTRRQEELVRRLAAVEEAMGKAEAQLAAERQLRAMDTASLPRPKSLTDLYRLLDTPQAKNELLRACLEKALYAKTTGGHGRDSDATLRLYPKVAPPR